MQRQANTILKVEDLQTYFNTDDGIVKAVDGVSFDLHEGETLGIVGESGSGKTVTNLSVMRLISSPPGKIMGGRVYFDGRNVLDMSAKEIRALRGNSISMIFQDPMTCLNPFLRISAQLIETIRLHQGLDGRSAESNAITMLKKVGIPSAERRIRDYPHQFSGGMRQRVMIAMGLSCNPQVLIADEPTSALDVTIQAQILELIQELTRELGTAVIMITHDLGIVAGLCDNVCVMYAGKIVEKAITADLFKDPKHPYTRGLIKSVPRIDQPGQERLFSITGQPPNLIDLPECCPFFPRCERVMPKCRNECPLETRLENDGSVVCWLYEKEAP